MVFFGAFFVYNLTMKKYFSLLLMSAVTACASVTPVNAARCQQGELMLEYVSTQSGQGGHTVRLMGMLDMPTPNYTYDFAVDTGAPQTAAELSLREANPDMMSMQVITPITIDETFQIPKGSTSLMVNISKTFGWGAEYFQAKFPNGFENHKAICMTPEMYK